MQIAENLNEKTTSFDRKAFQKANNWHNKEIKDNAIMGKVLENSMMCIGVLFRLFFQENIAEIL